MNKQEVIRAWKDPVYRASLNQNQLTALPANPAGLMELSDADLMNVDGAGTPIVVTIILTIVLTLTACVPPAG
jgi:mersacidin/lichenicidin family type 2 lantibiotic